MRVDLFDFDLPAERIALRPAVPRDAARLLVLDGDATRDLTVADLPGQLRAGDCLVFNDTRVIPAQLEGRRGDATIGSTSAPSGANLAQTENPTGADAFNSFTTGSPASPVQLSGGTIALQGGSQPHENRQPYLVINYIICLSGIFPPRQ